MPYGRVVGSGHARLLRDGMDPGKTESKVNMRKSAQASP